MTTGGGSVFVRIRSGSITTAPSIVGNQRRPSRVFQPAGCVKPLHSAERIPSARPKDWDTTAARLPSASSSSSARRTRKIPRLQLIQRLPRPSSRIAYCTSSNRPSRRVNRLNLPSLKRLSPPPSVPIQRQPSASS